MEIFNNPWFVGIGGGILSGIIVAYITRLIFSKRDNREYSQKLSQANHEVLYAVRPGISEGKIPNNGVLRSLIEATARKYGVDKKDMHGLDEVSSELIKEVMDSSFISASAKQEFCEKLTSIKEEVPMAERDEFEKEHDISARYRRQLVGVLSLMVGILTGFAVGVVSLEKTPILEPKNLLFITLPAIVAILIAFAVAMAREIQKMRLKTINLSLGGIRTEIKQRRNEKEIDS